MVCMTVALLAPAFAQEEELAEEEAPTAEKGKKRRPETGSIRDAQAPHKEGEDGGGGPRQAARGGAAAQEEAQGAHPHLGRLPDLRGRLVAGLRAAQRAGQLHPERRRRRAGGDGGGGEAGKLQPRTPARELVLYPSGGPGEGAAREGTGGRGGGAAHQVQGRRAPAGRRPPRAGAGRLSVPLPGLRAGRGRRVGEGRGVARFMALS